MGKEKKKITTVGNTTDTVHPRFGACLVELYDDFSCLIKVFFKKTH